MKRRNEIETTPESDALEGAPHPRRARVFFGNPAAEAALLDAYRANRLPQSWIIGGPEGIGKATLAWRFLRFLFAHPDPAAPEVQDAVDLAVPDDHPVAHKIDSQSLGDVSVLRREWNAKARPAKHFTEIRVDDVRDLIDRFRLSASTGGWRACVIDCAEDLNRSGANALLKLIEEPPPRCVFLIVSHAPGRILPTIRSRSRLLMMQPLAPDDVARAVASLGEPWSSHGAEIAEACAYSGGSVRKALRLLDEERLAFERKLAKTLDALPRVNWPAVHELADKAAGLTMEAMEYWDTVTAGVHQWLDARVRDQALAPVRLAPYAEVWEKVVGAVRETEALNLEKRSLLLLIFADLAAAEEAARR